MPVYAPGQTTGFNSVSDYLGANQGALDREAGDVNSMVGSELDSAKTAADTVAAGAWGGGKDYTTAPGYANALAQQNTAQQDAELTRTPGGLQNVLGRTPGGRGATPFDGRLLGAHGGFAPLQERAQTLHDYLNTTAGKRANAPIGGPIDPGRGPGGGIAGRGGTSPRPTGVPTGPTQSQPGTPPWGGTPPRGNLPDQPPWPGTTY